MKIEKVYIQRYSGSDARTEYHLEGKPWPHLHREGGPAIEYNDDERTNLFFLDHQMYSEKEWNRHPLIRNAKLEVLGI